MLEWPRISLTRAAKCSLRKPPARHDSNSTPSMTARIRRRFRSTPATIDAPTCERSANCENASSVIQHESTGENLAREVRQWLDSEPSRASLRKQFLQIHERLSCDASKQAADAVSGLLES